jgi:gluconokinase
VALTDTDRADWLKTLAAELVKHPEGAVLTCSALNSAYRDTLRRGVPLLYFVHLAITQAESLKRVGNRPGHFYPPSLVASQFEALQDPAHEPGVLTLDGQLPPDELAARAAKWLSDSTMRN